MNEVDDIITRASECKSTFIKLNGVLPAVVVIDWDTYETLTSGEQKYLRTLAGVPLRVEPFCPKGTIYFLQNISEI